jgi:hypothetical protein
MATKRKRTSCGYCLTHSTTRHQHCPGTLPHASLGKPWTCWCAESGHPAVIPPAPQFEVPEPEEQNDPRDGESAEGPPGSPDEPRTTEPKKADARKGRTPKEPTARCGHPTKRGPCNRKEGHTAGHDGR